MVRDTEQGKPRFDLLIPEAVPYENQLITRLAALMARGAEKYGERNWEATYDEAALKRAKSSALRHMMQWMCGDRDEDHAAAAIFNIMQAEYLLHMQSGGWTLSPDAWSEGLPANTCPECENSPALQDCSIHLESHK